MKLLYLLAPMALLGLASAAPPPPPTMDEGAAEYPPCSATLTDRCVQTYERGARGRGAGGAPELDAVVAEPVQVSGGDYPPCTASREDRCTQNVRHRAPVRYAMAERERIRIGERG
jgi:hypothetical protein